MQAADAFEHAICKAVRLSLLSTVVRRSEVLQRGKIGRSALRSLLKTASSS